MESALVWVGEGRQQPPDGTTGPTGKAQSNRSLGPEELEGESRNGYSGPGHFCEAGGAYAPASHPGTPGSRSMPSAFSAPATIR